VGGRPPRTFLQAHCPNLRCIILCLLPIRRILNFLDVPERVELLNKRLSILKELLEVLNTQLSNQHSTKLEIIVIWLIVAEIVFT
jgi:uncharacterized Rmd1/YagE family protein